MSNIFVPFNYINCNIYNYYYCNRIFNHVGKYYRVILNLYYTHTQEKSLSRYYPDCRYNLLTIDDAHPIYKVYPGKTIKAPSRRRAK